MKIKRFIGLILILISGVLGWTNTITGAVIGASSGLSLIPIILFIAGIILMLAEERQEEGNLPGIIRTSKFEKSIKRFDKKTKEKIEEAIEKIGTGGLGHQETLKHMEGNSIRVTNNARIRYHRQGNNYLLDEYVPKWHDTY